MIEVSEIQAMLLSIEDDSSLKDLADIVSLLSLHKLVLATGDIALKNKDKAPDDQERMSAQHVYHKALRLLSHKNQTLNINAIGPDTPAPAAVTNKEWIEKITQDGHPLFIEKEDNTSTESAFIQNYRFQSKELITKAEAIRGITHSRHVVTIDGACKTVLYRDARGGKKSLTEAEQKEISGLEFQASWCISVAAACKIGNELSRKKKAAFFTQLENIQSNPGKTAYLNRMPILFSLLGAFFPDASLSDLSLRLEAERDMIALDEPTEIVATLHRNGFDPTETIYDIEMPNTRLSDEQITFFRMAHDNLHSDSAIEAQFNFFKNLKDWQKKIIRRDAHKILEENRLRPSQMQFLPMAPNFWTRHTVAKTDTSEQIKVINVISRCGALSPRVKADKAGIIQFQKMQYAQVRKNFGLRDHDTLAYTSYKQYFFGLGADDEALEHITDTHDSDSTFKERNPTFNIPMGRFSLVAKIMNGIHDIFSENKFKDNIADPLLSNALNIINDTLQLTNPITAKRGEPRQIHDMDTVIPISHFMNANMLKVLSYASMCKDLADVTMTPEETQLAEEMKLDAEQIYRHVLEIETLRTQFFNRNNLRIAALRSVLYHKLTEFCQNARSLPGGKVLNPQIIYQAYVSGCKSNIDRGTLVTLHAEVIALKEHARRKLMHKTFIPTSTTPFLLDTKIFFTHIFSIIVNWFTPVKQLKAFFAIAKMERDMPAINQALKDNSKTTEQKAKLLQQKTALIDKVIDTNVSIEASVCESGHSRIMPSHGGSIAVSGVKGDVVDALDKNLRIHAIHLTSNENLSSYNHDLAEKCGMNESRNRRWVSSEHKLAAEIANNQEESYVPPAIRSSASSTNAPHYVLRKNSAIITDSPVNNTHSKDTNTSINSDTNVPPPSPGEGVFSRRK